MLQTNIAALISLLDDACHQSLDPPTQSQLVISGRHTTGRRGRPRIEVDRGFLEQALDLRGPTQIAPVVKCSARTIRRRALEHGLAQPGNPVFIHTVQEDGTHTRIHTSTTRQVSNISDEHLDQLMSELLEIFPNMGRSLIFGRFKSIGYHVPIQRITASYLRVHGTAGSFGVRAIHRRVYSVAGANSLWHHDGQHGEYTRGC